MAKSIREWLESLGLDDHIKSFEENQLELEHLIDLSNEDLKELGVTAMGHRKTMLRAIAELANRPDRIIEAAPQPHSPKSPSGGERRQLTVMFCDLVGSTALSARLDPEEYRDVLSQYRVAVSRAIQQFDGYIAQHMGDGLLAYFGYPRAHEDDAERSVRSGLGIVEAVNALKPQKNLKLQVRIGIATGLVVAGDIIVEGASEERAVLGDTPNLAARLQGIAEPNSVVVSDATRRLVEGRVELEALKPAALKGIEDLVQAFRAVAVDEASRFEVAAARGLSAMSGRHSELSLLQQRWERASAGEGQVVLLSGEPGIGKSRLTQELGDYIGDEATAVLRFQCSPYHTGSAFHPVIDQLQRAAGFARDDGTKVRLDKLETFIAQRLPNAKSIAAMFAAFLSLPLDGYPTLEMTPQRQKAETIAALLHLVESQCVSAPVLIIFEDAHWIDPSSEEFLNAVIDKLHSLKVLLIVTCRPEYSPSWPPSGHITSHSLNRLGRQEVSQIVDSLTRGKSLPAELLEQILNRTDGVPLFVEELTKTVLEVGILREEKEHFALAGPLPALAIPATLHDSLLARLDRLADEKEVTQTAACIGREFSPDLLAELLPLQRDELDSALEQLVEAELVFRRGTGASIVYMFKHALVQDAAYESMLISRRRQLHANIAEVLQAQFPGAVSREPERVAQHYTAAEMADNAIPLWLAAGRKALAGSSLPEANTHLTKALDLTAKVADAAQRAELELAVRTALGTATMALYGWPSPEVFAVVQPACDLFDQGYGTSDDFMNFWNLWVHHGCRAEHRQGLAVVERMQNHAKARSEPVLELISSFTASMAHFWVGDYDRAQSNEEAALRVYEFERDRNLVWNYNHDPKNTLLSWSALRVWASGYPDQARSLSDKAVAHARQVKHPFNLCWTLGNSSSAYGNSGDYEKALQRIDELRSIAQEQELIFIEAYMAPVNTCIIAAQKGDYELAYDEGARGEDLWTSIGGRFWSPIVRAYMALSCLELGRHDEARKIIDETVAQIEATGELMLAEEVYRIAGLVSLAHPRQKDIASDLFQKSLDYARAHRTRSFELRTSLCLARHWCTQEKQREARDLLEPLCAWFTEGFDTVDLVQAKTLLSELT